VNRRGPKRGNTREDQMIHSSREIFRGTGGKRFEVTAQQWKKKRRE
jgi:hypothetical protein